MGQVSLKGKHLLGLQNVSPEEIKLILDVAKKMKNIVLSDDKKVPLLKGKSIITSLWSQVLVPVVPLSQPANIQGLTLSIFLQVALPWVKVKASAITLLTMSYMGTDAIVMRHSAEGAPLYATKAVDPIIINAGDGDS